MFKGMIGRQNTIQALQVLLIVLAFVTLGAWIATDASPALIWLFRITAPLAALATAWWLFTISRQPERFPDLLAQTVGNKYFEKDGLCFAPALERASDGQTCLLAIYFQNRNAGHASATIALAPTGWLGTRALPMVSVRAAIECPGGAFGAILMPYAIPAKYQGANVLFIVAADTKYHAGRGELLRLRAGLPVTSIPDMSVARQFFKRLFGGITSASTPATVTMRMPRGVRADLADLPPATRAGEQNILWTPDLATGGFPVLPTRRAA